MQIAIIGCGEVGRLYASAVATAGTSELTLCDSEPGDAARALAAELGVPLHEQPGPWLAEVDRAWVCVTGDVSPAVCGDLAPYLSSTAVVVDLTTASPQDKRAIDADLTAQGLAYVDAVIMGAVGLTGVKTPILAAGPFAEVVLAEFAALGASVRCLSDASAGDAAALKLLRTVLTKGVEALAVECLVAAEQQGVRTELSEVLADIDEAGFTHFLDAVVRTHVTHARRRGHEIHRAEAQLKTFGLPSLLMSASAERFDRTAKALAEYPPAPGVADHVDSAVAWLLETTAGRATRPHASRSEKSTH